VREETTMKNKDRIRTKDDGIRVVDHGKGPDRRALWAVAAVLLVVLAMIWGRTLGSSPTGPVPDELTALPDREQAEERTRRQASERPARPVIARAPATAPAPLLDAETIERLVRGSAETAPERSEEEKRQQETTARELLNAAVAGGATTGIAAFPPPGTDPIKVGLVVPGNFELPEGFLRHHQITDDGRRLEPILMFSPDYEFVDADGKPVAVPEDGIVPAEMAPPGLPLRVLAVPKKPYGPTPGLR
jgi:hypothetical protein